MVQTTEITQRVHHATDEEKLASTGIMGPTADIQEERGESECNKAPGKKQAISDTPVMDGMILSFAQTGSSHSPDYTFFPSSQLYCEDWLITVEHNVPYEM